MREKPLEATASQSPVVRPWRHNIVRVFRLERWRIVVVFHYYRGLGAPAFEFEFRLGRPAPYRRVDWIDFEDGDAPATGHRVSGDHQDSPVDG